MHTSDSPYQPVTKTVFNRKAERVCEWWPALRTSKVESVEELTKATVYWNPGKKVHQVKMGDKIIFESSDKELAIRAANGETITDAA